MFYAKNLAVKPLCYFIFFEHCMFCDIFYTWLRCMHGVHLVEIGHFNEFANSNEVGSL